MRFLKSWTRIFIKLLLNRFGLTVVNKKHFEKLPLGVVDMRAFSEYVSPMSIKEFRSKHKLFFVINIPTEKLRSNRLISSWVDTLKLYERDKDVKVEERQSYLYLQSFYQTFAPRDVQEFLGLDINKCELSNAQREYFESHPFYTVLPWSSETPLQMFLGNNSAVKREFERNSTFSYSDADGCKMFGPVSQRMLDVEYMRLTKVYDSIKTHGYLDENNADDELDNFPRAVIFVKEDGSYTIESQGAWHRTAALLALDYRNIPFRVSNQNDDMYDERNLAEWTNVRNGLYTPELATILFRRI